MKKKAEHELDRLFSNNEILLECKDQILRSFNIILNSILTGNKLLLCGNGGSTSDCEHIVTELMKNFKLKRNIDTDIKNNIEKQFPNDYKYMINNLNGVIPALSLTSQNALILAISNDISADMVFAQQLLAYGKNGDVLIALSTSGNSLNVINAIKVAKVIGMKTIGFSGFCESNMSKLCDICINIPFKETYIIQEYHEIIYHCICLMLEIECFEEYK